MPDGDPETLVTACPLCKKTLAKYSPVRVPDIAEMVQPAIPVIPVVNDLVSK